MDPSYMHEFNPNRAAFCKSIVAGRHCGLSDTADVHTRYEASKPTPPFENFNVFIHDECFELIVCLAGPTGTMEDIRQFVEDAIREKLECS